MLRRRDGLPLLYNAPPAIYTHMVENNATPKEARRSNILPFDKAGKGPCRGESRRPISRLSSVMGLQETVMARGMMRMFEPVIPDSQGAYQRRRGTELPLAYLRSRVQESSRREKTTYLVGWISKGPPMAQTYYA